MTITDKNRKLMQDAIGAIILNTHGQVPELEDLSPRMREHIGALLDAAREDDLTFFGFVVSVMLKEIAEDGVIQANSGGFLATAHFVAQVMMVVLLERGETDVETVVAGILGRQP